MTALDKLIEAVEAGEIRTGVTGLKAFEQFSRDAFGLYQSNAAWRAYGGSIDAALALHEALLPGWMWLIDEDGGQVKDTTDDVFSASGKNPARVWLLCILRAYRSIQR